MENGIWLLIMLPCSLLFTGLGIYAWKSKKPVGFWSGIAVREDEIANIHAYNRANGLMWLAFSSLLWISSFLGFFNIKAGAIFLIADCIIGIPVLPIVYGKIYKTYKK